MANRYAHQVAGAVSGGGFALYKAWGESPENRAIETIGGAFVGVFAGRGPDFIDPPTSPHHRSIGHGLIPTGAAGTAALGVLDGLQEQCRTWASQQEEHQTTATDPFQRFWHGLLALLARLAAGALAGAVAAYGSHLLLDALTPAGLPLIA